MRNKYFQGKYILKNKDKYIGNAIPIYRSSYERKFFVWADLNKNVTKWGSEIVEIPYLFEVDGKIHKYITDVYCEIIDNNGKLKKYLIEIKPENELTPPKQPKNKNRKAIRNFNYKMMMYIRNKNKWKSADAFCKNRGIIFRVLTEKDLGI